MNRLLLGIFLIAFSWTASAADTALYKVELIVFENLDPAALQAEQWPKDPGTPPLDNAMELNTLVAAAEAAAAAAVAPPAAVVAPTAGTVAPATPAAAAAATPAPVPAPAVAAPAAAVVTPGATTAATATPPAAAPSTPAPAKSPAAPSTAPATPPPAPPTPMWRWLDSSQLSLNGAEKKLLDSGRYRPLLHVGWVQPLDSSDPGTPIHIYDGMKPQEESPVPAPTPDQPAASGPAPAATTQTMQTTPENSAAPVLPEPAAAANPAAGAQSQAPAAPATDESPSPEEAEPPHVIDGTFTLRRERFLHADVDLGYRKTYVPEGTPPDGGAMQPVTLYVRMTQSRRLRSDELHYLDHPLFGVLFVVSPYDQTPADAPPP